MNIIEAINNFNNEEALMRPVSWKGNYKAIDVGSVGLLLVDAKDTIHRFKAYITSIEELTDDWEYVTLIQIKEGK